MLLHRTTVTAIVPTFNRAHFLPECLASLISQTAPVLEIIVVDDGSTDNTRDVAAALPGIRYVRQDNRGKSAALNHGLALARGDAIWIIDDDDIAVPEAAERLAAALDAAPSAGFAFGAFDRFVVDANGKHRFSQADPRTIVPDDLHWQQLMRCSIFQGAMLVRRTCYDEVGPFDIDLPRAQDYDMLLRLTRCFPSRHVPGVMFHQRQHRGERGPAHMRIDGAAVWRRQSAFDAKVLWKARERDALSDFLPGREREAVPSPAATVRALLRRAAPMAQRGLWDAASEDVAAAMMLATSERLRTVPGEAGAAFAACFRDDGHALFRSDNPLLRTLEANRRHPFRKPLMRSLSVQPFLNGVKSLLRGNPVEAVWQIGGYLRITKAADLPFHLVHLALWAWSSITRKLRRSGFASR